MLDGVKIKMRVNETCTVSRMIKICFIKSESIVPCYYLMEYDDDDDDDEGGLFYCCHASGIFSFFLRYEYLLKNRRALLWYTPLNNFVL